MSKSARLTQWIGPPDQAYITVASTATVLISSVNFEDPLTILRTRGWIGLLPQVTAADVTITGAVGMAIVSAEALAAGVASTPSPYRDSDWGGWFVWRTFSLEFQFADATGFIMRETGFEVDSKAMRKVSPNEALIVSSNPPQSLSPA